MESTKRKMIYIVTGARPNFMKVAPLMKQMKKEKMEFKLIHTGQHYDYIMSEVFFEELRIPEPDIHLNVGSHSHAIQTAKIMIGFEECLLKDKPDLVIVVGDVNSTLACSLTAKKMGIEVAHVESGLRSFDMSMPEEINRILTDHISDYLFVSEKSGLVNLTNEGIGLDKTHFVGNLMIENLIKNLERVKDPHYVNKNEDYALITLHRPSNVDNKNDLEKMVCMLNSVQELIHIVFVVHPRTEKNLIKHDLYDKIRKDIQILSSRGYLKFLGLMINAKLIITDSGGIQEEASYLNIPVLTMRKTTERPITISKGTNTITGSDIKTIRKYVNNILSDNYKEGQDIEKWDALVSKRIVSILKKNLKRSEKNKWIKLKIK